MEALTDEAMRQEMQDASNIFRVLVKTLLKAGIITDRTRGNYAAFLDMAELHNEGDRMIGDDIAEEGIRQLIKLKAVYELLETITDRCEDVANVIEGIVLENS